MAGTPFETIYKRFFQKVDDFTLLELQPEDAEELLEGYLEMSCADIREARIGGLEYDLENKCFKHELTNLELELTALGLAMHWIETQRNSALLTKQLVNSKEVQYFSQRTHLLGLMDLYDKLRKDRNHLLSRYKTLNNTYLGNEIVLS